MDIFVLNEKSVQGLNNLEWLIFVDIVFDEIVMWGVVKKFINLKILKLSGIGIKEILEFQFENNRYLEYFVVENNKFIKLIE